MNTELLTKWDNTSIWKGVFCTIKIIIEIAGEHNTETTIQHKGKQVRAEAEKKKISEACLHRSKQVVRFLFVMQNINHFVVRSFVTVKKKTTNNWEYGY